MDELEVFIGRKIVSATTNTMILDDGTKIVFDTDNDRCCSWIELSNLSTTDHIITNAYYDDNEDETGGEGYYCAWIHVITEAGELNIAEADGNASNGYYLHGFALNFIVYK